MDNPLYSMDTLAHAKARHTIILMTSCTGSLGDTLDLFQDYKWFPFGFGLSIWYTNPPRAILAHIGCP